MDDSSCVINVDERIALNAIIYKSETCIKVSDARGRYCRFLLLTFNFRFNFFLKAKVFRAVVT